MESSDADKSDVTYVGNTLKKQDREFEYLCVDDYIKNIFSARALATAFETGIIDALIREKSLSCQSLMVKGGMDGRGMRLLLELLSKNGVVDCCDDTITFTKRFRKALEFRDLLELKIAMAGLAAHDYLNYFNDLVYKPDKFFQKVKFFRLFQYEQCLSPSRENYEATKRWMRITTTLTKYESQACMRYHDFSFYRRMLDIGGNSGEFALQICRKYPGIQAVVFDLPLVCKVGRKHLHGAPEANRISFFEGNALTDALPEGFDLVSFKSMLHDWPEREALQFISNAGKALAPGGTLLIFERGLLDIDSTADFPYSILPSMLFLHFFRLPEIYESHLQKMGFQEIDIKRFNLETPFFILTAKM